MKLHGQLRAQFRGSYGRFEEGHSHRALVCEHSGTDQYQEVLVDHLRYPDILVDHLISGARGPRRCSVSGARYQVLVDHLRRKARVLALEDDEPAQLLAPWTLPWMKQARRASRRSRERQRGRQGQRDDKVSTESDPDPRPHPTPPTGMTRCNRRES